MLSVTATSQELHPPGEILKLIEASALSYELGLSQQVRPARYEALVPHGLYVERDSGGGVQLKRYEALYESSPAAARAFKTGDQLFDEGQLSAAREAYLEVLEESPDSAQVMTYLGQTAGLEGDSEAAKEWCRRAIQANPYDYLAHMLLADLDAREGRSEEAVDRILRAQILNRNNPRIQAKLEQLLEASGAGFRDWKLEPASRVSRDDDGVIHVQASAAQPEWADYAACKALWKYEPGYRESMTANQADDPRVVEEQECLANFVLAAQTDIHATSRHRALIDTVLTAARDGMMSSLIVYEIVLKEDPLVAFQLDEVNIQLLIDYVKRFRIARAR